MRWRLNAILLIATLMIAATPMAYAESFVATATLQTNPYRSVFKGSNNYHYVFYLGIDEKIRYAYSSTGYSWEYAIVGTGTDVVSEFTVEYDGSNRFAIAYIVGSGTSMSLKTVKCTLGTPLSCDSPISVKLNSQYIGSISMAKHPSSGRWLIIYRFYKPDINTYIVEIRQSTDLTSWSLVYQDIMNGATQYAPNLGIAPIPGTSDTFLAVVTKEESGAVKFRYCRGATSFCGQSWTEYDSATTYLYYPIGITYSSVGVEVVTNGEWWTFTETQLIDNPNPAGGTTKVAVASTGSSVYFYWVSGNNIMKRVGTSSTSGGTLGSTITYMSFSTNPAISIEPRPASSSSRLLAYQLGSDVYWKQDPESLTTSLSRTISMTDTLLRAIPITLSQTITMVDQIFASRLQTALLADSLSISDATSMLKNTVIDIVGATGMSDFFGGAPTFLLIEIMMLTDTISSSLIKSPPEGGGGGGGGGAVEPPPVVQPPEVPAELPTSQVAVGSVVGAAVLFGVLLAGAVRRRRSVVSVWRSRRRKAGRGMRRRWRLGNIWT